MTDDVVIHAERVGKKYIIGHDRESERHVTLRDVVVRGAQNVWRKTADMARGRAIVEGDAIEEFWALKDVSFEVTRGEVLGIIGRNGAGKSTLLKILSRITEPTEGRVTINGRVASLLEVGTGFHPELTGRENIYLNGAILGMARAEITRKFDEIVAFAEVEKFLDTPVKRYSSGMYVRLAFAVAAHLEPEILIVDEVLAVGDAEFQRKCLGKMSEIGRSGRTIVFVSHNMLAVEGLTRSAIQLDAAQIVAIGDTATVIDNYLRRDADADKSSLSTWPYRSTNGRATIKSISFQTETGEITRTVRPGKGLRIIFSVYISEPLILEPRFAIETSQGVVLFASRLSDSVALERRAGELEICVSLPQNSLRQGKYLISFGLFPPDPGGAPYDHFLHYPAFAIEGYAVGMPNDDRPGMFYFPYQWSIKSNER